MAFKEIRQTLLVQIEYIMNCYTSHKPSLESQCLHYSLLFLPLCNTTMIHHISFIAHVCQSIQYS